MYVPRILNVTTQLSLPVAATNPSHKAKKPRRDDSASTPTTPKAPPRALSAQAAIPRITLSIDEAASALGVSRDHLERHILREIRIVYSGRRRLVPMRELERWAERQAVAVPSGELRSRRA
jgi:excisionase family DNA binding protein